MEQVIIDKNFNIEVEELHIILKEAPKQEDAEEDNKQYELHEFFKDLNPRYFEESIPVKDAIDRVYRSVIKFRSNFDFSRMF